MTLIKWTPFNEPLLDFDRMLDSSLLKSSYSPAIDLYEKNDCLVVDVAMAGMNPKNVKIHIEDNVLNIEGSTEHKREVDENNYYRKEVRTGSFHRVISLPVAVNQEQTKAEYSQGILTISMPKKEAVTSKPINVEIKEK